MIFFLLIFLNIESVSAKLMCSYVNSSRKIKIEVEQILKKSTQYAKIKDELSNQDDIIRFIIEAKQIISSFGFDIKNSIEVLKIENI